MTIRGSALLRKLWLLPLLSFACAWSSGEVSAQAYPSRPVRIIVPSPPGDGSDVVARLVADKLSAALGQPFVVENKPGAGGVVGDEIVAHAAPDGYTLVMANAGSNGINAAIYSKLTYDVVKDFAPITLIAQSPNVLVTNVDFPARSVRELVELARAKPGEINYASGGIGSSAHMSMELLKFLTHVDLNHIPYKGATPALTDLIGGQVPVMFVNLTPAIGHIRAGKIRLLAVTTSRRWPAFADTPTVAEAGVDGFETVAWFGLLAPAATPRAIIDKLHAEVVKVLSQPDVRERIAGTGSEVIGNTPQEFARRIQSDVDKWKKVAAAANIKAD